MGRVLWDDWVPGVLNPAQMKQLSEKGYLDLGDGVHHDDVDIDNSSIDLHLTGEAYLVTRGSVKPFGKDYLRKVKANGLVEPIEHDLLDDDFRVYSLERGKTYLFRLRESIRGLCGANFYGQATAKSTVGRVDVLARLVVDGMNHYEGFDPSVLGPERVDLYLEVTPITFPVRVKEGTSLSQLRFFYGKPKDCELVGQELYRTCFEVDGDPKSDNTLSVDLSPTKIRGEQLIAFYATGDEGDTPGPVDLWEKDKGEPDPAEYWRVKQPGVEGRLRVKVDNFYILRSKEKISLPGGVAVYARAIDEEIGEMRIHYAGFAHPFFGFDRDDDQHGTPLIFEVRGHNVDVNLLDGETMARLKFFRMSQDIPSSDEPSFYDKQTLKLSKFFGNWPSRFDVDDTGNVVTRDE